MCVCVYVCVLLPLPSPRGLSCRHGILVPFLLRLQILVLVQVLPLLLHLQVPVSTPQFFAAIAASFIISETHFSAVSSDSFALKMKGCSKATRALLSSSSGMYSTFSAGFTTSTITMSSSSSSVSVTEQGCLLVPSAFVPRFAGTVKVVV